MSTRSDTVVCLQRSLVAEIPAHIQEFLKEADQTVSHEDGVLYSFVDHKWYHDDKNSPAFRLYSWLNGYDEELFLVVSVTPEYPEHTDADYGEWHDNPWNVYRQVTATVCFDV